MGNIHPTPERRPPRDIGKTAGLLPNSEDALPLRVSLKQGPRFGE